MLISYIHIYVLIVFFGQCYNMETLSEEGGVVVEMPSKYQRAVRQGTQGLKTHDAPRTGVLAYLSTEQHLMLLVSFQLLG